MGELTNMDSYRTIRVRHQNDVLFVQLYRPDNNNTINDELIDECSRAIDEFAESAKVVVLEGLPDVFCYGADFEEMQSGGSSNGPEQLYNLWLKLATGPFVSLAHVKGKVNAGGIGFVAACDVVISERSSTFGLSELLFGLMPACVLPFLIRRIGYSKAHYMTLMTQAISAEKAHEWGLVDALEESSENLLRKHLLRLTRVDKKGVERYKKYINELDGFIESSKQQALLANLEVFSDVENLTKISRFIGTGRFPWEKD